MYLRMCSFTIMYTKWVKCGKTRWLCSKWKTVHGKLVFSLEEKAHKNPSGE